MHKDFFKAGNPQKIVTAYSGLLEQAAIDSIRDQARLHAAAIYKLGLVHYRFAINLGRPHWRQKSDGNISAEVQDHKKVGALPDGFPNRATYENELKNLREDRNSCDYDHMIGAPDLLKSTTHYQALITSFLRDAHDHLSGRGVVLERRI